MSLRTRQSATRSAVPLPLIAFLVTFLSSWLLLRTSSSTLYDPLTSTKHHPPPQPINVPIQNSIVVPAYHERANVRPLVERVFKAVARPLETELIIVDDNSKDGTVEEVDRLKEEGYNVELLVRVGENGLSSAVLRGFEVARGSRLVVMDADLQVRCAEELHVVELTLCSSAAPARGHSTPPRLALGVVAHRPRHALRQGRFHVGWMAHVPTRHLVGSSHPCTPSHECQRPHDRLLCHHQGAGALASRSR